MLIPVLGALCALLYHWGILPLLVRGFVCLLRWAFGIQGPLGLGVAANVFMGMVESPLLIRPYLHTMSRADLFSLMVAGMATVAGTVLVLYVTLLAPLLENAALHLFTASVMSCPAALMLARLALPEPPGEDKSPQDLERLYQGNLDAISTGTMEGMKLFLGVAFILVSMTALVHLGNQTLSLFPAVQGEALTLQRLLGWLFMPLAWLLGMPWEECTMAGSLLGIKVILSELVAYVEFSNLPPDTFSPRSRIILTYALCGFANLGSLGIMIAGLGTLVPERRDEVLALGGKSV